MAGGPALRAVNGSAPTWIDATDLIREDDRPRDWVIPGFLERQQRLVLLGAEGCGKSLLALTASVQAAMNLQVLERFSMDLAARTVYVDLEMGRPSTRRRLSALAITSKLEDGALWVMHRPEGIKVESPREERDFLARMDEVHPDLIVFDPLYKLTPNEVTSEQDTRPVLLFLDKLRVRYGCGIVLVHHLRKRSHGETQRGKDASDMFGSSVLLRWPELILTLNEQSLRIDKDRDNNFEGVKFFPVKRGGSWPIHLDDPRMGPEAEVIGFLRDFGPASANEIHTGIGGNRSAVLSVIRTLEHRGTIFKRSNKFEAAF